MAAAAPHDPPFRAEHIGSFLRPPALLAARAAHRQGEIDAAALRAAEDTAIRDVVRMQEAVGLSCITDGEFRRHIYSDSFTAAGLGIAVDDNPDERWRYADASGHAQAATLPRVRSRIRWTGPANVDDFRFVQGLTGRLAKMTLPGPCYIHFRAGRANISRDAYPDLDAFWADLIDAYRQEIAALHAAGCRYIQLDETALAKLGDPRIQSGLADRGDDWRRLLDLYIDVINQAVAAAPADLRIGIHLCRGNNRGHWQAAAGYDHVAEALFRSLRLGFYFLEYDSPRAGTFEPLRAVPDGKTVVLGLISTKVGTLEDAEAVERRIEEAARHIDRDRLALSPQCGFASQELGNAITPEEQAAKLRLVVDVAREMWGTAG